MEYKRNIVIGDESALFALLHSDWGNRIKHCSITANPLFDSAERLVELSAFNVDNPIYGHKPIVLLIPKGICRRQSSEILCRYAPSCLSSSSFFMLREGLYLISPELTYLRMAPFKSVTQLAQIAMNLCARYYIDIATGAICNRTAFLTTPDKLQAYCQAHANTRSSQKAMKALQWVYPNSGSPTETIVQLLLTLPQVRGGFALPFTHMNFDVRVGQLACITEQSAYSIDCVNPIKRIGVEYDGRESHPDSSHDKRRRIELKALGWDIFPLEYDTLGNPDRMTKFAHVVAKCMGIHPRRSYAWSSKYLKLRKELGLRE